MIFFLLSNLFWNVCVRFAIIHSEMTDIRLNDCTTQGVLQAVIPLLARQVLPDGREVEYRAGDACLPEPGGRAHHEARFAHLPRCEHIAEAPFAEALKEIRIGPADHVRRSVTR